MKKRKRVDEVRWAVSAKDGTTIVLDAADDRDWARQCLSHGDTLIRVRITEVPKKKRSKK